MTKITVHNTEALEDFSRLARGIGRPEETLKLTLPSKEDTIGWMINGVICLNPEYKPKPLPDFGTKRRFL